MADEKRTSGTMPLPALEKQGGGERGEDPSRVTADWCGQEVGEAVGRAQEARQGLEDDLSRLLGRASAAQPAAGAADSVAFAPTQELAALEDTAPKLPAAAAVALEDTSPRLPASEAVVALEDTAPKLRAAEDVRAQQAARQHERNASGEVVVFTKTQQQQVEAVIRRQESGEQALVPTPTDPVGTNKGSRGPLILIILIVAVLAATGIIWFAYLT